MLVVNMLEPESEWWIEAAGRKLTTIEPRPVRKNKKMRTRVADVYNAVAQVPPEH
jgi:hypothetical protein